MILHKKDDDSKEVGISNNSGYMSNAIDNQQKVEVISEIVQPAKKIEQIEINIGNADFKKQTTGINVVNYANNVDKTSSKPKRNRKDKQQYTSINKWGFEDAKVMQSFEQFKAKCEKSLNKDLPLKYYTKLLLSSMGYYCDIEVNMLTQSFNQKYKKEQISDIDVLGCKIENDLSISFVPVECKSGEDGALDELLKLKGIMDYLGSNKGYLVKNKIASNAREMGENIKVSTMDYSEIRQLLHNLALLDNNNDSWIEVQIENYIKEKYIWENAIKFTRIIEYIKNDYWHQKNYRNIQNLIFLVSSVKDTNALETKEGKYILLQVAKYLSLSIIQLSSYVIHKNYSNPVDKIKEYIFGGARERREKEVLFDRINQILASQSKTSQSFEPEYTSDIIEICLRFVSAPNFAKQAPICIENCIHSFIIESAGYDKDKIIGKFKSITLKFAKDVIVFVCKQANLNPSIFNDILNL